MTPKQFNTELRRHQLDKQQAADLLGVNYRTINRWLAGERPVPPMVEHFLTVFGLVGTTGQRALRQLWQP